MRFCLADVSDAHTGTDILLPNGTIICCRNSSSGALSWCIDPSAVFPTTWARRKKQATVLVDWNDVFAVTLSTMQTKLWIDEESAKKEVMLLTERMLGSCVYAQIRRDLVHEIDMVNVSKVQKAVGLFL
ncbi:hypothetical protein F5146DRAFT_1001755 [Armillaria mellea]|nr:hypothetical protein F5146DRAFT_1001755 [Armillaria mellea]